VQPTAHAASNGVDDTVAVTHREARIAAMQAAPEAMQAPAAPPDDDVRVSPQASVPGSGLALPPDSNLVLVETRFSAPSVEDEQPAAPRPRRTRPPRVTTPEEPLQMVETHKQDNA